MMERGTRVAGTARWAMFAALAVGAFGCELITSVDRSLIDGAGGTAATSTTSSTGGSGGSGGTGGSMPGCTKPDDCPAPANECVTNTCEAGKCGTTPVMSGTPAGIQTAGDCKSKQCDGKGAVVDANDDTDVPNDNKECTDDKCAGGVASNANSAAGTACGAAGATTKCDGNGACVGCASASDCPAAANECQTATCTVGVCGFSNAPAGTLIAGQTAGDCKTQQCDGSGAIVSMPDNNDKPVDNKACTDDVCTGGVPSNPNTMAGGACTEGGGTVCDGSGACAECLTAATCPAAANECQTATCTAGVCGISFKPAGTATATQTAGDCKKTVCNATGVPGPSNDDTDLPNDNNPCTGDVCTAGVISHPFNPAGTACGSSQTCNATGSCGCTTAADCSVANECQTATCIANMCGTVPVAAGTMTTMQTTGDCKKNQCDGAGAIVPVNDDLDLPIDNVECTSDVCTAGVPSNPPVNAGAACTQMGGTVCSGNGACVQCNAAADCSGTDTDCKVRTCTTGVCGFANTPAGTLTSTQTVGDCLENQCDGSGSSASTVKATDVPVDNNQCTNDVCTGGVPSNPFSMAGTACNQNGGAVCDAAGMCVGPSCTDGVKDGTETGIDCGGSCPNKCAIGGGCGVDGDCTSGTCTGNVCSLVNGCDASTATDLTGVTTTIVTFANGNLTYAPKCIKVKQGTTVTFNGSFASHPLLGGIVSGGVGMPAGSGPFVPVTNSGSTKDFPMTTAGTYPYYCTAHASSNMDGAIFVVP